MRKIILSTIFLLMLISGYGGYRTGQENQASQQPYIGGLGGQGENYEEGLQVALYRVDKSALSKEKIAWEGPSWPEPNHIFLWQVIKKITPARYLAMIKQFEINTDGQGGTTAFVYSEDNINWTLAVDSIDILDANANLTKDGIRTLIHEISHIISLNHKQMADDFKGDGLQIDEGRLKPDSYLNLFYRHFWSDAGLKDLDFDIEPEFEDFWKGNKDRFVSQYAATNPVEDFAESFAEFVLRPQSHSGKISDQKINFFYRFPDLVEIRKDIRKRINSLELDQPILEGKDKIES